MTERKNTMKKLISFILLIMLLLSIPGICGAVRAYKYDAKIYAEQLSEYLTERAQ